MTFLKNKCKNKGKEIGTVNKYANWYFNWISKNFTKSNFIWYQIKWQSISICLISLWHIGFDTTGLSNNKITEINMCLQNKK